jgi:hypothetical protein
MVETSVPYIFLNRSDRFQAKENVTTQVGAVNVKQVAARILQRSSFIQHLPFDRARDDGLVRRLIRSVPWCSLR